VTTDVELRDPVTRQFQAYVDRKRAGLSAYDLTDGGS
jgi:hypothetical protein